MKYFWPAIFVFACTTEPEPVPSVQQPAATEVLPALPPGHPEPSLGVRSRGPRRMSVEQIERSLDQIGLLPEGTVKIPDDLAVTLGRPDYQKVTEESLEPSPLFMKFMMDLGAIICTNLGTVELERPQDQRVYLRSDDPEENLRRMVLVFTGIEGADADPYVARLWRVYSTAVESARGQLGGYEAVCLALFTSPEFLLY